MRVKIVGCLGPIAMRQNAIEVNKVIKLIETMYIGRSLRFTQSVHIDGNCANPIKKFSIRKLEISLWRCSSM